MMYFHQTGIRLEFTTQNAKLLYILPNDVNVTKAEPAHCINLRTKKK